MSPEYKAEWKRKDRQKNPEKYRAKSREYRHENQDKLKEKSRINNERIMTDPEKREEERLRAKAYYHANKEKIAARFKQRYQENKPKFARFAKESYSRTKPARIDSARKYRTANRKSISEKKNAYDKSRRKLDKGFAILCSLRARTSVLVKRAGAKKIGTCKNVLGCTIPELRRHLEQQFRPGMTWKTYGRNGWHVDHIRPLAAFDMLNPDHQAEAFHFTNLQPLWWYENLSKGSFTSED